MGPEGSMLHSSGEEPQSRDGLSLELERKRMGGLAGTREGNS